jgi:short-subunit dehydrogenase
MHVVITGASSGIGAALAREFHRAGAHLTLVARRQQLLEALVRELGSERCQVIVRDLAEVPFTGWLAEAERQGPIDVFINNAGIQKAGPFIGSDARLGNRLLDVNLLAPMALAREVVPRMVERRAGTLVNISSVAAMTPPAGMAWYVAAKAGLAAFSEALRAELVETGVNVLTVYPGPVDNGSPQETFDVYGKQSVASRIPIGQAADIAREIRRAVEQRQARLIYPKVYSLAWWAGPVARWAVDRATPKPRPVASDDSTRGS